MQAILNGASKWMNIKNSINNKHIVYKVIQSNTFCAIEKIVVIFCYSNLEEYIFMIEVLLLVHEHFFPCCNITMER